MADTDNNIKAENGCAEAVNIETAVGVFEIPKHAVKLHIIATVFENEELCKLESTFSMDDIKEALRKADEGYVDPDAVFTLTDKGRELFEQVSEYEKQLDG